jgi:hypothetical protein
MLQVFFKHIHSLGQTIKFNMEKETSDMIPAVDLHKSLSPQKTNPEWPLPQLQF